MPTHSLIIANATANRNVKTRDKNKQKLPWENPQTRWYANCSQRRSLFLHSRTDSHKSAETQLLVSRSPPAKARRETIRAAMVLCIKPNALLSFTLNNISLIAVNLHKRGNTTKNIVALRKEKKRKNRQPSYLFMRDFFPCFLRIFSLKFTVLLAIAFK